MPAYAGIFHVLSMTNMKKIITIFMLAVCIMTINACAATDENEYYDYDSDIGDESGYQENNGLYILPEVTQKEEYDDVPDGSGEAVTEVTTAVNTDEAETKGEINICLGEAFDDFDPLASDSDEKNTVTLHLFEGLMKYKSSDQSVYDAPKLKYAKAVYGQAQRVEYSEDSCVLTFYLRDDIYWNDGQPVCAEDFVYAWRRLVTPQNGYTYGNILNGIVKNAKEIWEGEIGASTLGVSAPDEKTFVVELEKKCPYFLRLAASPVLVPLREDVREKLTAPEDTSDFVTNGIYEVEEYSAGEGIKLRENVKYYLSDAAGYGVLNIGFDNIDNAVKKYSDKEYDFVLDTYGDNADAADEGEYLSPAGADTNYLIVNKRNIKDWRISCAMLLAADRDALCEDVFSDTMLPLYGMIPHGITSSNKKDYAKKYNNGMELYSKLTEKYSEYSLDTYEDRLLLAKKLADDCFREGTFSKNTEIRYVYNKYSINKRTAKFLAKCWQEELELNVVLYEQALSDYVQTLSRGDFDLARMNITPAADDPVFYLTFFTGASQYNFSSFYNYDYEQGYALFTELPSSAERDDAAFTTEAAMFAERTYGCIPLYQSKNPALKSDSVNVLCYSGLGYYLFY